MKTWNQTSLSRLLGIAYPIVQGPFGGGLSSAELTAIVSNAGGLGSFGGQPFTAGEISNTVNEIRKLTGRPFNINLWVGDRDTNLASFSEKSFREWLAFFQPIFEELNLPIPDFPLDTAPRFEDQVQAIFDTKPAVFSFVYGIPSETILSKCQQLGIVTIGAATNVQEAIALENAGVDAIVATGFEAGGHRVSFLREAEDSLMGSFALIPQVADAVSIPVIAAGGIADARGIKAALSLGAAGVQIGTAFLATAESKASRVHKELLFRSNGIDTVLTRVFTGRLSRGLKNQLTTAIAGKEAALAPYPFQSKLMSQLYSPQYSTAATGNFRANWAGQAVSLLRHSTARELFDALVNGMKN